MISFENFPVLQYVAAITGSLNLISSGMNFGWSSISLPKLLAEESSIKISNNEGSWIVVMLLIGAMIGSTATGALLDKIGRKGIMIIASMLLLISWIVLAYSNSVLMLLIGRFISGLGSGPSFCAPPVYLTEISSPKNRGFVGSLITVSTVLGMLIVNVAGVYLNLSTTALLGTIFPILSLLTITWLPKSPYYLIMKNKVEQARNSIKKFKTNADVEYELQRLNLAINEKSKKSEKWSDLFTVPSNRRAVYIMLGTRGAQQCCGNLAICFYINTIFAESGNESVLYKYGSIIYFSVQLILSVFSSAIVDRAGRKPLMIVSLIGIILCLLPLSLYFYLKNLTSYDVKEFDFVPIVALIIYVISFNIGMVGIPLLMIGEIFPTNSKAFAVGFSDVYFSISTLIVTKFFQITKDTYGLQVPFFAFLVCSVLGCVFIIMYVPETKGKTLEEIQELLKIKKLSNRNQKAPGVI